MTPKERNPAAQVHNLPCWPPDWEELASGRRGVVICEGLGARSGDWLVLREVDLRASCAQPTKPPAVTGRVALRLVTHVLHGVGCPGLVSGYDVLSLTEATQAHGTEWVVFWGGPDPDHCSGTIERDDLDDAREFAALLTTEERGVAHRTVFTGPWVVDPR